MRRWFLTQFYTCPILNITKPICAAYGGQYFCPTHPELPDGWALVYMLTTVSQIDASKQDPRVLVMPLLFDTRPLPEAAIDAYASWGAVSGMGLGSLLAHLSEAEPAFSAIPG